MVIIRYILICIFCVVFFRKPTRPSLTLREGPPLSPSPFPLRVQGMYQPLYSVLKPLRYKVGGPSEVYAKEVVRDGTALIFSNQKRLTRYFR